eukprot:347606_1
MDSLHYYTTHLFDTGLRTSNNNVNDNNNKSNDVNENELMDNAFKNIRQNISKKIKQYGEFDRFKSSKFNINVSNDNNNHEKEQDIPFLDEMFTEFLTNNNKITEDMKILKSFLHENEYDTDAFKFDFDEYIENDTENNSNIIRVFVRNSKILSMVKQYMKKIKYDSVSDFSIGLIFYYWPYY